MFCRRLFWKDHRAPFFLHYSAFCVTSSTAFLKGTAAFKDKFTIVKTHQFFTRFIWEIQCVPEKSITLTEAYSKYTPLTNHAYALLSESLNACTLSRSNRFILCSKQTISWRGTDIMWQCMGYISPPPLFSLLPHHLPLGLH